MDKMREAFERDHGPLSGDKDMQKYFARHECAMRWAWQAAQSVPVVGEAVAWFYEDPFSGNYLTSEQISCNDIPLYFAPATCITQAELERLRKDAAKVLHSEQIRIAAVAAVRAVTGCPDIKGKDGAYLVDEIIARLLEMQNDAAIAAEWEKK